jgi:hypothetical protein
MREYYEALKKEIRNRHEARLMECRDTKIHDEILRAQGRGQELFELIGFMENMENPPKDEEKS